MYIYIYMCVCILFVCVYIYIYIYSLMDQLSSNLHINENNTDISLYQILYENISKYNGLNLFKEIAIGFIHGLETTVECPGSLSTNFFI